MSKEMGKGLGSLFPELEFESKLASELVSQDYSNTMDSREIAELTGKRHADVLRDVEVQLSQIGDQRRFASVYLGGNGEKRPCYKLPKRECLIVVSGYSVELRAKIIDRWMELEYQIKVPQNFSEALRLAADLNDRNVVLEKKAAVADQISIASNEIRIYDFAKSVHEGPLKLYKKLADMKILYKNRNQDWVPYEQYLDRGYFVTRIKPISQGETTINHSTTLITGKGVVWLTEKLIEANARVKSSNQLLVAQ